MSIGDQTDIQWQAAPPVPDAEYSGRFSPILDTAEAAAGKDSSIFVIYPHSIRCFFSVC